MQTVINLLTESLSNPPIGETHSFIWLATPIGIAALCKNRDHTLQPPFEQAVQEGMEVSMDLSREEKEFHIIQKGLALIFYS